jgi:3-dehydroquinate synthetase
LSFTAIYNAHLHDKKFIHGKNRFILPLGIGSVRIVESIPGPIVARAIKDRME